MAQEQLSTVKLQIMTINVNGKGAKGNTEKRRELIANVIEENKPHIVMLQEFQATSLPETNSYRLLKEGNDAVIMYDQNQVSVSLLSWDYISDTYKDYVETLTEEIGVKKRITIVRVVPRNYEHHVFICISWHGPSASLDVDTKYSLAREFLDFVQKIVEKEGVPVVIGGDFNVSLCSDDVKPPFVLPMYTPSTRREGLVIDFFIHSENIRLTEIGPIFISEENWDLLDHDPLIATLTMNKSIANLGHNASPAASSVQTSNAEAELSRKGVQNTVDASATVNTPVSNTDLQLCTPNLVTDASLTTPPSDLNLEQTEEDDKLVTLTEDLNMDEK